MSDDMIREIPTVSIAAERNHDRLREDFVSAWNHGRKPRIEEWLERVPDDERMLLFGVLARAERDLRPDDSTPDDLRRRFPEFEDWIETIFRDHTDFDIDIGPEQPPALPEVPGYRVLDRIAFGGMGVVYKAVQTGLDRVVAIKMVRGGTLMKDDELTRFRVEARAVAGIVHPNIVHVHELGTQGGLPFIVMEYVDGGSLSQKLAAEPINFRDAAALIETLARAMQFVHDRQIIHRDLKPGNILLAHDGTPKISDFGLAKRLGSDLGMTVSGTVMGTASYMAPEQARGDKVAEAADIYALGAILYECLTGQPPFRGENYEMTIRRVTDDEPTRPRELISIIPPELEAICLKCLEKDPLRRYMKAVHLADDLRRYLNAEPLSIGTFDLIDQHERWAKKIGLEALDLIACTPSAFVYRAREEVLNRAVKLKICTGTAGSPAHLQLRRQAEAMAGFIHPNLEQIYTYGESGGQPYLLLEYVAGRTLSAVIHERVGEDTVGPRSVAGPAPAAVLANARLPLLPLGIRQSVEWVATLARALQFLQEHRIVHGGIYPGEIRLNEAQIPRLCGFGAAQKLREGFPPQPAYAPWVRPNYQPPEQIEGRWAEFGPASDVYSLGAVLYELLTGQVPFAGLSIGQVRQSACKELPVAPRNLNPRIPQALDAVCQRCMARKPADRYASAAEVADLLERFLATDYSDDETAAVESGYREALADGEYELRIFLKGHQKPAIYPLPKRWVAVGRAVESDVVIPDEYCSRHHCAVYWDEGSSQHVLILIKAKHGVKVNGEPVRGSQALIPGDVLQIASARLAFVCRPKK